MTLSEIAIRRPVFAWMLMSALIIFGAITFNRLGISFFPDIEAQSINISVTWPGAAPEVMETEIVDRLEQALVSVVGVKEINSSIRQSIANITLELYPGTNADAAILEVQSGVSRVRLPDQADNPIITRNSPSDNPIMWIGVNSDSMSLAELIAYADLNLRDQFQTLPGVGEIILSGFSERNLRVWIDRNKLEQYELTALDVQRALESEHIEVAAGYLENPQQEINLRVMGEGLSPESVGEILITQRGGRPIYNTTIRLRDVARIEDDLNDIRRVSKIGLDKTIYTQKYGAQLKPGEHVVGFRGIGLGIRKLPGANAVAVSDRVKQRVEEIRKRLPPSINMQVNFDQSVFTREAVHETEFTLILAAILTSLVCWIFLGSWTSTLNVIMAIPTSVLGTFIIMYFSGFTLNFFTLLALSLSIGVVVDDAIMVLENIVRHKEMGKSSWRAALDGAREITFPALAATFSIVAIFFPLAFTTGIVGEFLFQFAVTFSAAVLLSYVEAITLTPMRCSQFLQVGRVNFLTRGVDALIHWLSARYVEALRIAIAHRWKVLAGCAALFFISLQILSWVPKEFAPAQDQSIIFVRFQTPVGSSLEFTVGKMEEVEAYLKRREDTLRYFIAVGGFGGGEVNTGIAFVTLVPPSQRKLRQQAIIEEYRRDLNRIEDLFVQPVDLSRGGFTSGARDLPIQFSLQGPSHDTLKKISDQFIEMMKRERIAVDIDTDFKLGQPEWHIIPNRVEAARRGVTMEALGRTLNVAVGGVRAGKFTNDARRYDVRVKVEDKQRQTLEDVLSLKVRNLYGELVAVRDVVTVEKRDSFQVITRRNRERAIQISANNAPGITQAEALARVQNYAKEVLPPGYRLVLSDNAQAFKEAFADLSFTLFLGVVVAYMVLASQFNSFVHPFTILLTLPFSVSGAFGAMFVTGQTFNIYSFIGLILLMGIVKKNGILLVEFTNLSRTRDGLGLEESILRAGAVRLRPIVMTSFTTIVAALPAALAWGPGAESRVPMAVTVIGGVLVSTLFTLFVVPCAYRVLAWSERFKPRTE
ncbi:MAG: efflux RND transporter permease subunit [Verrucomicrobiae bacterium]|nr:efflux RND transporter permease subunit [Verrucomicrobiae bacterium]